MLYPNRIQAALLFDRSVADLAAIVRAFAKIEGMRSGAQFHLPEENPGRFYRLYDGAQDLMVTFEYCDHPCNADLFRAALSSPFIGMATPDINERITRTHSHILLEVSRGTIGGVEDNPKIAAMFEAIGRPRAGASLGQFERRLSVLGLMARVALDHAMPLAVHGTQSDLLVSGEMFDTLAESNEAPGPLHIHQRSLLKNLLGCQDVREPPITRPAPTTSGAQPSLAGKYQGRPAVNVISVTAVGS
jgi:hypothetical protein